MKDFRVHGEVRKWDQVKGKTAVVKFSDVFRAKNPEDAIELAHKKFEMVHDDLNAEFQADEEKAELTILGCEEE